MSGDSNIAWTNATWNPTRGCERVSPGCKKCYAEVLAARHSYPGGWGEKLAKWVIRPDGSQEARWTGVMQMMNGLLDFPLRKRRPSRIFVNSMSDLFHKDVPVEFIDKVFAVMGMAERHTFQILTKRPDRMLEYLQMVAGEKDMQRWINAAHDMNAPGDYIGWLERETEWPLKNVWLGVSAEDQQTFDQRVPILGKVPAAVRWVSAEPLLGSIDARCALPNKLWNGIPGWNEEELQWMVVGGESGQDYRLLEIENARSLIQQCKEAGVPIFVKQDHGPRPGLQGRFTAEEWALKEYPA